MESILLVYSWLEVCHPLWNQKDVTIIKSGSMFFRSIDGFGDIKDKYFIVKHM